MLLSRINTKKNPSTTIYCRKTFKLEKRSHNPWSTIFCHYTRHANVAVDIFRVILFQTCPYSFLLIVFSSHFLQYFKLIFANIICTWKDIFSFGKLFCKFKYFIINMHILENIYWWQNNNIVSTINKLMTQLTVWGYVRELFSAWRTFRH